MAPHGARGDVEAMGDLRSRHHSDEEAKDGELSFLELAV
jgi:hypothetical protein